ncbi:MAG: tetratricopeptide repeat protein [Actinobacteria bacterium]|nr:tetratricopeptide repeat protein [Actinomycetota bacterium]
MQAVAQLLNGRLKYIYIGLALLVIAAVGVVYYGFGGRLSKADPARLRDESYQTYRKSDFKGAILKLQAYLRENQGDIGARNLLVTSYAQVGELASALKEAEKVVKMTPNDADALYRAGQLASELRRFETAVSYYKSAIKARPEMIQYHYRLAEVYTKLKKHDGALLEWEAVLELFPPEEPHRAVVYGKVGDIYLAKGERERAKEAYNKGLAIKPGDQQLTIKLAKAEG